MEAGAEVCIIGIGDKVFGVADDFSKKGYVAMV